MASIIDLLLVFLTSFGFNLIPFAGPSNLFIASNAALLVPSASPFVLGFLVAFGAAVAKSVHYLVTFFIGKHLSQERRKRLDADAVKIRRWAFLLLYAAAATPIPDEPVIIPLGLMKYSPTKFFVAYFLGKLSITIIGAFLGSWVEGTFSGVFDQTTIIALSIALTVVITVILLKVDMGKLAERFLKRKNKASETKQTST